MEIQDDESNISSKTLDLYEDEALHYYLKHRRQMNGISNKRCRRIAVLADHFKMESDGDSLSCFFVKIKTTKIIYWYQELQTDTASS